MNFRIGGPKRASKTEQKRLIQNAKEIAEDPMKVIPECGDSCLLCKFGRAKKKIKKIAKYKDDKKRLEKYSKKGPDLARAVAGTMLLALEEEAPRLSTTNTPDGEISYAKKGKASKKRLIGVQHFTDLSLRLLTYAKEADKGYYFYSWDEKVVCTGKNDSPPDTFVKKAIYSLPYDFISGGGTYRCRNISKDPADSDESYLKLKWNSAGKKFFLGDSCARPDMNLYTSLTEGMVTKDITRSFSLDASYKMDCEADCSSCKVDTKIPLDDDLKDAYFKGIPDQKLLAQYKKEGWKTVKMRENVFAISGRCFGNDKKAFYKSLPLQDWEKPAIKKVIGSSDGIVLEDGTINELLSQTWKTHGKRAINALVDDQELAAEIYRENDIEESRPRDILRKALDKQKSREVLNALPTFKELPDNAEFAHEVVKIYRTDGKEGALKYIEDLEGDDSEIKSIAYGFLLAFDKGGSYRWKYKDNEVQSGEFLKEYVEMLLDTDGEDYAHAMKQLLKLSGSTEKIVMEDGTELT